MQGEKCLLTIIENFQFETLRVSNHTACRPAFSKGKTL